jgi:hypothetical protein
MKKIMTISILALLAGTLLSCKSAPATGEQNAEDAGNGPLTQDQINARFDAVYDAYRKDIILDGAATHIVVWGDTLTAITRKNYGANTGYYFPLIMLASEEAVSDPDLILPGMKLTIPDLQKNLDSPKSRTAVKSFLADIAKVYERKNDTVTRDNLVALSASL